jgi:hypothetical protein
MGDVVAIHVSLGSDRPLCGARARLETARIGQTHVPCPKCTEKMLREAMYEATGISDVVRTAR